MNKQGFRRLLAALLALLMLASLVGCGKEEAPESNIEDKIPTDGGFYLVLPDEKAKPGEKVTVKLVLSGNPGIGGFSFCVNFDKEVLSYQEGKVTLEDNAFSTCGENEEGINFIWTSMTPYTGNGEFCEFTLLVSEDAQAGSYPLTVSFREGYDSFYKIEGDEMPDLPITGIDGEITVEA